MIVFSRPPGRKRRAFNEGTRETGREIDFVALRQALAKGTPWTEELVDGLMPKGPKGKNG